MAARSLPPLGSVVAIPRNARPGAYRWEDLALRLFRPVTAQQVAPAGFEEEEDRGGHREVAPTDLLSRELGQDRRGSHPACTW